MIPVAPPLARGGLLFSCLLALAVTIAPAAAAPARIAVLLDGESPYTDGVRQEFEREVIASLGPATLTFPPECRASAGWTTAGAAAALDGLLARKDVDVVLALGPLGSGEMARRKTLARPVIASLIVDAQLQKLPYRDGASGVRNLSYVNVGFSTLRAMQRFHDLVAFHRLAVLMRPGLIDELPEIRERAGAIAESMGVAVTFVPVTTSAAAALAALPAGTDGVYLGPIEQLSDAGMDSLVSGLNARRIPTSAFTGRNEIERGALASYAPKNDLLRRARRVAGNLQRILNGEDAGTLPVGLASISQLMLNMETARAIGFSPTWITLGEAELIHAEAAATGPAWTLVEVGREAIKVSRDLRAADRKVAAGRKDVAIAAGQLFPQVQAQGTGTMIREETAAASLGQQAERQTEGKIGLSLPIVSDQKWANLSIEKREQAARVADRRDVELEAVYDATTAYLNVLRAKALATVERENVRTTRTNLELAQLRLQTGASSRADVYRWEAELAQGRRRVLDADASVALASLELNRLLDRPLEEAFRTEDATALNPALATSDPRLLSYFATPETFRVFRDFMVEEGRRNSPTLVSLDAAIAAQRRAQTAARRSLWLPSVSVDGSWSNVFSRDGAGSSAPPLGPIVLPKAPDDTWSVRLSGALPLFDGQIRAANLARARIEIDRLSIERESAERGVAARVRAALQNAAASWLGIEQARQASESSVRNLELVTDAYSRGSTNVITLLDAQQAALSAQEGAANAVYDFLVDQMAFERALGNFGFFNTPEERDAFLRRMDDFYRAAGVEPVRR